MKNLASTFAFLLSVWAFSQCTIQGPETVRNGETHTYTISGENPACADCYHWNVVPNFIATSYSTSKQVTVRASGTGSGNLVASYPGSKGEVKCSISVDILNPGEAAPVRPTSDEPLTSGCELDITDISVNRIGTGTLQFAPVTSETYNFKTKWVATYQNGNKLESSDRRAEFYFLPNNSIIEVNLNIDDFRCKKKLNMKMDPGFFPFMN